MSLFEFLMTEQEEEEKPLTVSELNQKVRQLLESDFSNVCVEGEVINFSEARSGHWYFGLHDDSSQIKAVCYAYNNCRIRFHPFDGLKVRVRGRLTVYLPKGEYQILVESLLPVGEGALKVAFEQIKEKLEAEGLFDQRLKRPLPKFPSRVGVVTSPDGAAFFDILAVLLNRTKAVNITLIPTRVQGENAGEQIEAAIRLANFHNSTCRENEKIDVLIVGRGGGASEDLWAFNEERVARAIRESKIPVISAVGHEIDFTIADYAADYRAPTPSVAAEIVAEAERKIQAQISDLKSRLIGQMKLLIWRKKHHLWELISSATYQSFRVRLDDSKDKLVHLKKKLVHEIYLKFKAEKTTLEILRRKLLLISPLKRFGENKIRFRLIASRLVSAMKNLKKNAENDLRLKTSILKAISPLSMLNRGFAIVQNKKGEIIASSKQVKPNEELKIRLVQGQIRATVSEIKE